ncbi:MAG: HAD family phosphatase [Thermodesulfobacteriota bacterium]|nr:HAD family phosphatase [Thermodesulfobacteriota bacterium]
MVHKNIKLNEKAVLWDLDGVVVDTASFHFEAWRKFSHTQCVDFTEEDFRHTFGLRNLEILEKILKRDLHPEEIEALSEEKETIFRDLIGDTIRPLPGVLKLLETLKTHGVRQALVSSTPIENIELILSSLDIKRYFGFIVSANDVKRGKPDPEGFLLAAEKLFVKPKNCVVIEDAIGGVQAAKNAGAKCIAIVGTHPRESLSFADVVVDSLEDVNISVIESLVGK